MAKYSQEEINYKIDISINELVKLAEILGRCPKVFEYEAIKHEGFCRRELEKRLNIKYNDICRKYLSYELNHDNDIKKEKILLDIKNMLDEAGKPLTLQEMKSKGLPYSHTIFNSKCGMTFNQIISYLGYIPKGTTTLVKTKDELLNDFINLFNELNRIPYGSDFENREDVASVVTYNKYFGNIKNVCELLNIDYEKHYKGAGAGKICLDKHGDICKSLQECNISNFLIDNILKFENQPKYSELIKGDNRLFDWKIYIDDKAYYVEYAGMYCENPRGKMGRKYKERTEKKISDLKKYGHIESCLFIFPEDIKNKSLKEIFEDFLKIKLKHVDNQYNISIRECFNLANEQLLEIIMSYSDNQCLLPSAGIISKKESGIYKEILKRFKTYDSFAKHFNKRTICSSKNNKKAS